MITQHSYSEYQKNLYTQSAMNCVRNGDSSNVYEGSIPVAAVRERFAAEKVVAFPDAFVDTSANNFVDPETGLTVYDPRSIHLNESVNKIVRLSDYHVHGTRGSEVPVRQYDFLIDLLTGVLGESAGDLKIKAAGTTRNGGRGYMQIATDEVLSVKDVEFQPFLNVGMSHDQSLSITSIEGTMIFACANMVDTAFSSKGMKKARTRQTKNATDEKIITKHQILLGLEQKADEFTTEVGKLLDTPFSDEAWSKFLDELAPLNHEDSAHKQTRNENLRGELNALWSSDERVAPWNGTAFGAVQAVNTYDLWERGTRGANSADVRMFDEFLTVNNQGVSKRGLEEAKAVNALHKVLATV